MSYSKYTIAVIFALFAILTVAYANQDLREYIDRVITTKIVKIKPGWSDVRVEKEETFYGGGHNITRIEAINMKKDHDSSVSRTGGGVGYTYVTLKFKGEVKRTIKYNVTIYAM